MKKIVQVTLGGVPFAVCCLTEEQFGTVMASKGKRTLKGKMVSECREVKESAIPGDEGILTFKNFIAFFP